MAAKKRNRKKNDPTIESLETSELTDVTPEQPTDVTPEQPTDVTPEQPTDVTPEQPTDATPEQPTDATPEQPIDATPEQPTDATPKQNGTAKEQPNTSNQSVRPERERRFLEKPQRAEFKPIPTLTSASNEAGVLFNIGDKILVRAPWGGRVTAEITGFYQDDSGNAWARYTSSESHQNWSWLGGCTRASLLGTPQPEESTS